MHLPTGAGVRLQAREDRASPLSCIKLLSEALTQLLSPPCLQHCPSTLLRMTPAICDPHTCSPASLPSSPIPHSDSFPSNNLPLLLGAPPLAPWVRDSCCFFLQAKSPLWYRPSPLLSS